MKFLTLIARIGLVICMSLVMAFPSSAQSINYDLSSTSVLRVNLPVSQAVTVVVSEQVGKIVSADPKIAEAQPITDRSLYLVARSFGTTTVNLFTAEGAPVGLLAVEVSADVRDMTHSIRAAVPNSKVKVSSVNGRIHLSGSVADEVAMQKVLAIVEQYGSPLIVNTLTVSGGRQVNLEVRILEAQRDAGKQLGIQWGGSVGGVTTTIGSNGISSPTNDAKSFSSFVTSVLSGISGVSLNATINALESKQLVRTLAEPNLTTLSGVNASFLAGGQVPIRIRSEDGNTTLEYRDFGVRLVFTPVVLDEGRIQIKLAPEVSSIGAFTANGDPIFNTRNLDATVELRDGQSFSVAGLIQNKSNFSQEQLPWIGDVPVLGTLFKSSGYKKHDTELVVIVTPRLVQPAVPGQVLASPIEDSVPANDFEFFALGQLEVTPKMIKGFRRGAGVVGAYGYMMKLDG